MTAPGPAAALYTASVTYRGAPVATLARVGVALVALFHTYVECEPDGTPDLGVWLVALPKPYGAMVDSGAHLRVTSRGFVLEVEPA